MIVYSESGDMMNSPDLEKGWIEIETSDKVKMHHPAIPLESHIEERDEKKIRVIDQHPKDAWDEYETYGVYHPYTQEELDAIEAERNKPTMEGRLAALEQENAQLKEALDLLLSGATEEEGEADG